jgi:Uncharacterised nucleotidyltransferase
MMKNDELRMKNLSPEDELLFALTRQSLLDTHRKTILDICSKEKIKWGEVCSISELHDVSPLIYSNLRRCLGTEAAVPEAVMNHLEICFAHNVAMSEKIARITTEIISFFRERHIDIMLLKGIAMEALVYEHPWYTIAGDVDIVLRPRREDISDKEHKEIVAFVEQFPVLECDYFQHHDVTMTGALPINFERIWRDATRIEFRAQEVFVMSPEDMLLSACINGCRKRFFRLKSLFDIAEILNRYKNIKWDELTDKAREYGCRSMVYSALLVTKLTLGCDLPEQGLERLKIGPTRQAIIKYLGQRMSLTSLSSFNSGARILSKKVGPSLLLPYANYRWKYIMRIIWLAYMGRQKLDQRK